MPVPDTVSPLVRELDVSVVERDVNAYLARYPSLSTRIPTRISLASLSTPSTSLATAALSFAHSQLDSIMFNHSLPRILHRTGHGTAPQLAIALCLLRRR